MWGQRPPEMFKKEAFASLYQVERHRAEDEVEMPEGGSGIDLLPNIADPWNGRLEQSELSNLVGILRGVGIGHHQAEIVSDKINILISETAHNLVNVVG